MYKIKLVAVGAIKEKYLKEGVEEYAKRLNGFCRFSIEEVAEYALTDERPTTVSKALITEGKAILQKLTGFVVVTDIGGSLMSSEDFSKALVKGCEEKGEITVVIGSSHGIDECVKKQANLRVSFGRMTMPHRLMRLVLCEQLYRAFAINAGKTYHK